jgi:hypothetical protein
LVVCGLLLLLIFLGNKIIRKVRQLIRGARIASFGIIRHQNALTGNDILENKITETQTSFSTKIGDEKEGDFKVLFVCLNFVSQFIPSLLNI